LTPTNTLYSSISYLHPSVQDSISCAVSSGIFRIFHLTVPASEEPHVADNFVTTAVCYKAILHNSCPGFVTWSLTRTHTTGRRDKKRKAVTSSDGIVGILHHRSSQSRRVIVW